MPYKLLIEVLDDVLDELDEQGPGRIVGIYSFQMLSLY